MSSLAVLKHSIDGPSAFLRKMLNVLTDKGHFNIVVDKSMRSAENSYLVNGRTYVKIQASDRMNV